MDALNSIIDADFDVIVEGESDEPLGEAAKLTSDGTLEIKLPDGSVVIDFSPRFDAPNQRLEGHDENLADKIDPAELGRIGSDLWTAITTDDQSRSQWLEARARGIDLLGLKLDDPKSDIASGAPLEGMSTVRDPILLEACIRFMSNASAELLPASGPVKVRNDGPGIGAQDQQAETLERDMNTYLTTVASDYYPDTRRMLFMTGFGGSGFKKVYHSPLKNRPVSEYVDAKDLIVSNAAVDLSSAARVTQVVRLKPSDMVRMQILGVYRDVSLFPQPNSPDAVDQKVANIQGIQPTSMTRPEDQDYELWECYCELDIQGFEHKIKGKKSGLPLPYRVTIDKTSQQVLEVRRNWDEDDTEYQPRKTFVEYSYIKAFGFYGIGLLHILGNIAVALTAGTREVLDAGMLANFPGFLYLQTGSSKQMTNHFRVPPGGGAPLQSNGQQAIRDMVMPLPYKEPGPAFMQFLDAVRTVGQRVGNMAETQVGEGKQNAPVGTTLALIEQQMKVEGAVHKGLHASQSEELRLLKRLFQEDPEALWRHRKGQPKWNQQNLVAALNDYDLVPQADPNTPSHMHRIMKWAGVKQLQMANPTLYDARKVDEATLKALGIDNPQELFAPQQPPMAPPPDPRLITAGINAQVQQAKIAADAANTEKKLQTQLLIEKMKQDHAVASAPGEPQAPAIDPKLAVAALNAQVRQAEIEANRIEKEKDRDTKLMVEKLKLAGNLSVHPETEPMVKDFLDVDSVPYYEGIEPWQLA
jgi:hypothetical protein